MFSRKLPLAALVTLFRALRHGHSAGLDLVQCFRQQAKRGSLPVRPVAERVADRLAKGDSLVDALDPERAYFPDLLMELAEVGEKSGRLPDVFQELEQYYDLRRQLRNQFITQITWPVLQLCGAIFVVTMLLLILGMLTPGFDPVGLGTGWKGVIRFWFMLALGAGVLVGGYFFITVVLRQGTKVHQTLLSIPVLGPTLHALALLRFCIATRATWEAGMGVKAALKASLRATGNPAYAAKADEATKGVKRGDPLVDILERCAIFPSEFLGVIATAEESGRLPEVMKQQAEYYREEAERRMRILTRVASSVVYFGVAVMIIFLIFKIYSGATGGSGGVGEQWNWALKTLNME